MVEKNKAYKSCCRFNRYASLSEKRKVLQNQLNISIEDFKQSHYSKLSSKFVIPLTNPKTYLSI